MSLRIVLILLVLSGVVKAQQFQQSYSISLPDSITMVQCSRVDIDNDGLLDVMLLSEISSGRTYLQIVKGDTASVPFLHWKGTRTIGPVKSYVVTDYDRDNRLDVVISSTGGKTAVYLNRGSYSFTENPLSVPPFSTLLIADLNDDARPEWVMSDDQTAESKLLVYQQAGAFTWVLAHDSLHVTALSFGLTDENYDGRSDVFVSGRAAADSVVSTVLLSNGKLGFTQGPSFDFFGKTSAADVNADGIFDFVTMGRTHNGVAGSRLFQSDNGTHQAIDLSVPLSDASPFVADFNSDGIVDYNFRGKDGSDTLNFMQYSPNNFDTIPSAGYRGHLFGDEDRDGDLDLLIVSKAAQLRLTSYTNMTELNGAPSMPKRAVVMRVFDRSFYYWDPSLDDHTAQASITYDLYIDRPGALAGEFDLLNEKRLSVTHGNNGTQNFKLIRESGLSPFAVQAIDNSFQASRPCIGSGTSCASANVTKVLLCVGEKTTIQAPHEALWFSFKEGYLGRHSSLEIMAANDTIFYYDAAAQACDALRIVQVVASNDAVRNVLEQYACVGQTLHLEAEAGWTNVKWYSYRRGDLGSGVSIDMVVSDADTVTAIMTNAAGCIRKDKTVVKISAPAVAITPELVRIASGSTVQLMAVGAERYEWSPTTGLSAPNIANPVASPSVTTTYTVTGYDSLSCLGTAQGKISVESGGFLPNLFTPNADGKNDEIRIYGLTEVHDFVFTIHNREGNVVYRTNNLSEATQKGWDGTRQGAGQPAGVYFWKVKGELSSGERLLLNGKDSGSIVLIR